MKTAEQRQFEKVTKKLGSLVEQAADTLELMPLKGLRGDHCQKIHIANMLAKLSQAISGIELEDFTPNEYSGDFKITIQ